MKKIWMLWSLVILLTAVPAFAKNENKHGNGKNKAKHHLKRDTDKDVGEWARRTEGHRPQDQNGDGRITRNEWPGNDESFRRLDRDGDRVITDQDRKLTVGRTHDYRNRRFGNLDLNKDGRISPNEWQNARGDFKALDRNRDGVLTSDEFRW